MLKVIKSTKNLDDLFLYGCFIVALYAKKSYNGK